MRFNDAPVSPEKINLIINLLNDPEVNLLWREFVMLGQPVVDSHKSLLKQREEAFQRYAKARDKFLGLPPLVIEPVQGTQSRYRF